MARKTKYALSAQKQAAVDSKVREAAGKAAVEKLLKSSLNPKYGAYQFFGLSDGNVVNVRIGEEINANKMAADSATVKSWKRKRAADMKRAEAKLAKAAAKKAEAK
ncbi:MAG TPA: hypothetical protein VJN92_15665 [Candidatus Acidoferrum sp.]|nr:hypothetical protein [Candidatus Acidoferrum sp.]